MRPSLSRLVLPLSAAMLLPACAAQGEFPSLAPRPIEQEIAAEASAPATVVEASATADPALAAAVTAQAAEARRGQQAFADLWPAAAAAAERSGDAGSEAWIEAQQAISRLEASRAPTVRALADLDRLALLNAGSPGLAVVTAALDEVRGLAENQERQIGSLRERLSPL